MKHSKATVRLYVREICAMAEGYGCTEAMIYDAVNERLPGKANLTQVRDAVEWNVSKNYLRHQVNEDTDESEWVITQDGLAKERIR